MNDDERWMRRALALAERGRYTVSPNPMVGALVVARGKVAGRGFHRRCGEAHAEAAALAEAGARARGATLYVTLEPCNHQGATPPCCEAILAAGIARVVVAARDPNRRVAGGGNRVLVRRGVAVETGVLEDEARRQNERFLLWARHGRPFIHIKAALSLDGKLATAAGESRWISGVPARRYAMALREELDAVLVGAGTARTDDPLLTRRLGLAAGLPHWRVVADSRLRLSPRARMLAGRENAGHGKLVRIYTLAAASPARRRRLEMAGAQVIGIPGQPGALDLEALVEDLADLGVTGLLVEGGGELIGSFVRAGLYDKLSLILAPKLLGGVRAPALLGSWSAATLALAPRLEIAAAERLGEDLLVTAYPKRLWPRAPSPSGLSFAHKYSWTQAF